jgi:hypothetical protein
MAAGGPIRIVPSMLHPSHDQLALLTCLVGAKRGDLWALLVGHPSIG